MTGPPDEIKAEVLGGRHPDVELNLLAAAQMCLSAHEFASEARAKMRDGIAEARVLKNLRLARKEARRAARRLEAIANRLRGGEWPIDLGRF